ncbi:MAG: quinone-dependent dihydroorotate dehydrogenase [Sulfitobacter sp.]
MNALIERLGLRLLHQVDPEAAHGLAIRALRMGLTPRKGPETSARLRVNLAGLQLDNPVGLAAGFDKNATAIAPLSAAGFGFIEVGAATPLPQPGNDKPRLFRLTEDRAAINRFGFNNDGMEAICARIAAAKRTIPVGLNLGANKTSTDRADDFAQVMAAAKDHVDFATVNVSSPNTEKLRDLQGKAALAGLLQGVMAVRGDTPVFLKIAPDLTEAEIADVAQVASESGVAAIIATNTTLSREDLKSAHRDEMGGLSGAPLFEKSTRVLARLSTLTDVPIIGVGGISNADQAYAKICAGAQAVQLYTALVYGGLSMVSDIAHGLDDLLARDGFATVSDAVGSRRDDWLD